MRERVYDQLVALNQHFYEAFAGPFDATRQGPQPGFERLLAHVPEPCPDLLDVGCGNGRLGRYLLGRRTVGRYVGLDFSENLIAAARARVAGDYFVRDLSRPGALLGLGEFAVVACLATLQHIPGRSRRVGLLAEMGLCLAHSGRLLLSSWQFLDSERQRRKIVPWSEAGLKPQELERGDYLLTWENGGRGLRYVSAIDEAETQLLAEAAGLQVVDEFRADGREGNLNLYTVLTAAAETPAAAPQV